MKNKTLLILFLIPLPFILSCTGREDQPVHGEPSQNPGNIIARDIIYDVEIKNPSTDDPWMDQALKGLDREVLIDLIFNGIYDKHLKAYDIFTNTGISARKILQMEENDEFSRDQIGKIQFTEEWTYDSLNHVMSKKVNAISFGLQNFDPDGYLRGYDPLFKVVLP